jgi:micrococcal nuclease
MVSTTKTKAGARSSGSMAALSALLVVLAMGAATARAQEGSGAAAEAGNAVTLNGELVRVRWSDGDSFRFLDGPYEGQGVRLSGYNALESYGPVHRWGEWTAAELYEVSAQATAMARSARWTCTTTGETDNYDRVLVTCDDLTLAMVAAGLGHLFMIGDIASPEEIAAQHAAQTAGAGMWAKGTPSGGLLTSLHSLGEDGGEEATPEGAGSTYNRIADTATGQTTQVDHSERYETCQEVCHGDLGAGGSCMVYVPFSQRYGAERADCLR